MTNKAVWFITGAGRGLGLDIAKSALAAGHAVLKSLARSRSGNRSIRCCLAR
ncbi:MAG: hypothetical protein JWQ80_926 [Massilia sp.]|nr:hypothetical protein [Massilia sp.]